MKKSQYIIKSLINASAVLLYVFGVSSFLSNAKYIFGEEDAQHKLLIPIFMLILLIISATITGLLVLGKPVHLYFSGQKKEALIMLFTTLAWLVLILCGVVAVVLLTR